MGLRGPIHREAVFLFDLERRTGSDLIQSSVYIYLATWTDDEDDVDGKDDVAKESRYQFNNDPPHHVQNLGALIKRRR